MKKTCSIIVVFIMMLSSTLAAFAEEVNDEKAVQVLEDLYILDMSLYENEDTIMRIDALCLIMRSAGFITRTGETHPPYKHLAANDNSNFSKYAQLDIARPIIAFSNIVYGEEMNGDEIYFNCQRAITTEETVAFMVRCLNHSGIDPTDLEALYKHAFSIGLLKESDDFAQQPKSPINKMDFFVLLHRFVYQPIYLYYDCLNFADSVKQVNKCFIYVENPNGMQDIYAIYDKIFDKSAPTETKGTYIEFLEYAIPILEYRERIPQVTRYYKLFEDGSYAMVERIIQEDGSVIFERTTQGL